MVAQDTRKQARNDKKSTFSGPEATSNGRRKRRHDTAPDIFATRRLVGVLTVVFFFSGWDYRNPSFVASRATDREASDYCGKSWISSWVFE